jgi:hypothetical protein
MTKKFGWSKNILIHQIENQAYGKTLLGQTNFDKTVPEHPRSQAKLAVRDEYTFDFLELGEDLEFRAIVVMACDDEVVPSQERIEAVADDADLEEVYNTERHPFYVA